MSPDIVFVVSFWALIAVWPLVYVCYPVALLAIARLRGRRPMEVDLPWPTVAILVAAHNEEETIERCVRSCLAQRADSGERRNTHECGELRWVVEDQGQTSLSVRHSRD